MKRMSIQLFLMILILTGITFHSGVKAQVTTGAAFLRMTIGSRAQAMGDAYTGLARHVAGMYYNPAGLGFSLTREIMLFHAQWFEDIALENLSGIYPVDGKLTFGAGISYLHLPEITRYEIDPVSGGPLKNGTFGVADFILTVGMGYKLGSNLGLGANVKYFQEKLENVSAQGVAFDLGVLAKLPIDFLSVGFAVQNLGPKLKYQAYQEELPLTYRIGMAYQLPDYDATITIDGVKTKGVDWQILPGIEIGFMNSFYIRGGYQFTNREGNGMTAGFGLKLLNRYKINYVYSPYGDLGDTHRGELIFTLGTPGFRTQYAHSSPETSPSRKQATKILSRTTEAPNNFLPIPTKINISKVDNGKILLTWKAVDRAGVKYNVYVRKAGSDKWIRVTKQPIRETYKLFKPRKKNFHLEFSVTAVYGAEESNFSKKIDIVYK